MNKIIIKTFQKIISIYLLSRIRCYVRHIQFLSPSFSIFVFVSFSSSFIHLFLIVNRVIYSVVDIESRFLKDLPSMEDRGERAYDKKKKKKRKEEQKKVNKCNKILSPRPLPRVLRKKKTFLIPIHYFCICIRIGSYTFMQWMQFHDREIPISICTLSVCDANRETI